MKVVLVLLVPVLLFSAWQYTRREENENRLALAATEIAQREVGVSCPGFFSRLVEITPNAGWVDYEQDGSLPQEAGLSGPVCRSLERVWRGDQTSFACLLDFSCDGESRDATQGILVLAHESWHLRGVRNEAQTHCYAIQSTERVALALGISAADARLVSEAIALLEHRKPPGDYRSPECRPGGDFDLHPETPYWPG